MVIFQIMRQSLGAIIFILMGVNFFYQGYIFFRQQRKMVYSADTMHRFRCSHCEQTYEIDGASLKDKTRWAIEVTKSTPTSQTRAMYFKCPNCHKKVSQEKMYERNMTELGGNVRLQMDENQRRLVLALMIKGFGPILLGMPLLSFLL